MIATFGSRQSNFFYSKFSLETDRDSLERLLLVLLKKFDVIFYEIFSWLTPLMEII